jgi:hypothetical protein
MMLILRKRIRNAKTPKKEARISSSLSGATPKIGVTSKLLKVSIPMNINRCRINIMTSMMR